MAKSVQSSPPVVAGAPVPSGRPVPEIPPGPRVPKILQGIAFILDRKAVVARAARRYGGVVTLEAPIFGHVVVVTDPALVKQVFTAHPDALGNIQPNLSRLLGPGSVFALDGAAHRRRRKLLTPPFHGKSITNYQRIFEEETLREAASWPDGIPFPTLEPMMRITLNAILRAVFGADGEQLDVLRRIIPPWVTLGSKLAVIPAPQKYFGRLGPWARLAGYRRTYDAVVDRLIDRAKTDPAHHERNDVLALLVRSTHEDGSTMSNRDIADELLTLLAAGHETTASTMAWAFERISRHPDVLGRLVEEAATDGNEYRQAVLLETQRARTVIEFAGRHVYAEDFELGGWSIPRGYSILVALGLLHRRDEDFPEPGRFDPERFLDAKPSVLSFVPFGGGTRRCVGAVFANVEMDVVLRTVLRHFTIDVTTEPDERIHNRGVAYTPKSGGRVVLRRRASPLG